MQSVHRNKIFKFERNSYGMKYCTNIVNMAKYRNESFILFRIIWDFIIDLHPPQLVLLYLACFLDRTNIGNAKIAHLTTDLKLDTWHYNDTLTIFFVSYSVFEALANILLKRFRPSVFLPITM